VSESENQKPADAADFSILEYVFFLQMKLFLLLNEKFRFLLPPIDSRLFALAPQHSIPNRCKLFPSYAGRFLSDFISIFTIIFAKRTFKYVLNIRAELDSATK